MSQKIFTVVDADARIRSGPPTFRWRHPRRIPRYTRVRILEESERTATMWDMATAAEAAVVLEDYPTAAKYLEKYVVFDSADAFELASTLRQFEQVLLLDRKFSEEAVLLDLLRGELLKSGGGTLNTRPEIFSRED